jgi:hypothetical protein
MLLNLSNHPSAAWSAQQLLAAQQQFGEVIDFPFPNIEPALPAYQVQKMAKETAQFLQRFHIPQLEALTIHVMGEMTFTYHLVREFQKMNIPCVASTSNRTVLEEGDGKKTVQFEFVQFRRY